MIKLFITVIIFLLFEPELILSNPLHTREMMMQIVDGLGDPLSKTVKLYKNYGNYFALYRTGTSESYWRWTAPNANVVCDIGDNNTINPTWDPIEPGDYLLWCDNKFATLHINAIPTGGDGDFNIKFQGGFFIIIFNNRGVTIGPTQNWDKIKANFIQLKSDGISNVGTVAIGQGSSFSDRLPAPFEFNTNTNDTYLFDADPDIYNSEKYHHYQNITNVRNFREQYIGIQNYSTTASFNPTLAEIIIQNVFVENLSLDPLNDVIQFKDPWLIDYNDPLHGNKKRNRGTYDAIFQNLPSPFYPNYITPYNGNTYKGIFLNQEIAPNNAYYSVKAAATQNITLYNTGNPAGRNHIFYFQNWGGSDVAYENTNALETGIVFTDVDAVSKANLKGTQLSDDENAYENSNQRKFVISSAGYFHIVYESMGKVWYERSIDEGQTWEIMNGGKPLNDGLGKYPSIDFNPSDQGDDQVVIVYWEESITEPSGTKIIAKYFDFEYSPPIILKGVVAYDYFVVDETTQPAVSFSQGSLGSFILVTWNKGNISYRLGRPIYTDNLIYWDTPITELNFGGVNIGDRKHPTLGSPKGGTTNSYWLAWDENNTQIKFLNLIVNSGSQDNYYITEGLGQAFSQAGYSQNYQPSISVTPDNEFRLSWFGYRNSQSSEELQKLSESDGSKPLVEKRIITWSWDDYQFYIFGTNVSCHSMSATEDGTSVIMYGDHNGTSNKFVQLLPYYQVYTNLNSSGPQTHLSNGPTIDDKFAMSFQNNTVPHFFNMSSSLGSLNKVTEIPISSGREAVVGGDSAQFYFILGDIRLNGEIIDFIKTGRHPDLNNLDTLNYYLSTEEFTLTNSSQFEFSIQYGVTDSLKAVEELAENEHVTFTLQLVNANNGRVIGEYAAISFTKQNIIPYYGESFSINTGGIGRKNVKVRFVVEENVGGEYSMANLHADESILPKQNQNVISYSGSEAVTEYFLEQNYPNPFNPTTTIRYQIPTSGNVSIKVYDILGNEVGNLVDSYKETGKYEVSFDASSLASGVYIYRLNVNDFVNVKKMVLLK